MSAVVPVTRDTDAATRLVGLGVILRGRQEHDRLISGICGVVDSYYPSVAVGVDPKRKVDRRALCANSRPEQVQQRA